MGQTMTGFKVDWARSTFELIDTIHGIFKDPKLKMLFPWVCLKLALIYESSTCFKIISHRESGEFVLYQVILFLQRKLG
jgi:hypothetical protein